MTNGEYINTRLQIAVLQDLMPVYSGKTLDNVVDRLQARVDEAQEVSFKKAVESARILIKQYRQHYEK